MSSITSVNKQISPTNNQINNWNIHIPQNLCWPWALSSTHHLGISSSKSRHSDFTRRRSYTPYSTFNLTRLRSATSGDISPSHDLNNKQLYFEDGIMAAIPILRKLSVYPFFITQQQQLLIWMCARWILAVLQKNLHDLLIPSINVMLTYLLKLKPCYRITTL